MRGEILWVRGDITCRMGLKEGLNAFKLSEHPPSQSGKNLLKPLSYSRNEESRSFFLPVERGTVPQLIQLFLCDNILQSIMLHRLLFCFFGFSFFV